MCEIFWGKSWRIDDHSGNFQITYEYSTELPARKNGKKNITFRARANVILLINQLITIIILGEKKQPD